MVFWDDTFAAATDAATREAQRLGAQVYGSEYALLGLLASGDAVTQQVVHSAPTLTLDAVRSAVSGAVDDASHLAELGVDLDQLAAAGDARSQPAMLRNKHSPEFQTSLHAATSKWLQVVKQGGLPRERKLGSAQLWLAVLEPMPDWAPPG